MELIHIFLILSVGCFSVMLATGKPDPPKDVRIHVIGRTAKISWTIPINIEGAKYSRIYINDSRRGDIYLKGSFKYIEMPITKSTFEINTLKMCSEYYVRIQFLNPYSEFATQKFWMTNKTFTADINQDVALSWTTSINDFFSVLPPLRSPVIYVVQGGTVVFNYKNENYIFDKKTKDVRAINFTVIHVNKSDAGLYKTEADNGNVDGCCLLIVTTKPVKPTLTIHPLHPFVGDNLTITCNSMVQRWPGYFPSHLLYHFFGNKRGDSNNNSLSLNNITKLDEGTIISCQATDDLGKRSIMADSVRLDPYYGPENFVMEPPIRNINVTEGTALGPIFVIATCNPGCIYHWKQSWLGRFNPVPNEYISHQGRVLKVEAIKRNQTGTYRCRVDHSTGDIHKTQDISVNVQYSPKITDIWFSSDIQKNRVRTPTTFSFNEDENVKMTLRVESNPNSQIMFKSSLLNIQHINKGNAYTDYTSNLPSLKCEDSGNFSIQAINGIPYADTRTVNLKIWCKPRNATAESGTVGAKVGTVETIVLHVISFPAPNVRWVRVTGFTWKIAKDKYDYRLKIHSKIFIRSEEDFGVYGINICNRLGCIVEHITVKPQDEPILSSHAPPNSASISHLTVGLLCGIPPLLVVFILLVYIGRRNKNSKSDLKEKNVKSEKSDEYTIIQRNNPTFTDAYSTLQSPPESTALPTESMETNTYDECGVLANVEVYETMDDRKSGNIKDEQGSGQEKSKERMYDNMKI